VARAVQAKIEPNEFLIVYERERAFLRDPDLAMRFSSYRRHHKPFAKINGRMESRLFRRILRAAVHSLKAAHPSEAHLQVAAQMSAVACTHGRSRADCGRCRAAHLRQNYMGDLQLPDAARLRRTY
jgi:hypothetical protein